MRKSQWRLELFFFIVVLAIFLFLLFNHYYRIQMIYNIGILQDNTPDSFELFNKPEYDRRIRIGIEEMMHSSAVFCGLLRDREERIDDIKAEVDKLAHFFKDYRVIIVENDSKDKTREKLLEWAKENPKVVVLGCGVNVDECKLQLPKTVGHSPDRRRIEKMAHLRNMCLDYIKENLPEYDYMVAWDFDITGKIYVDGFANSFGYFADAEHHGAERTTKPIDAICAYGIFRTPVGYLYGDSYAHIDKGDNFHSHNKFSHDVKKRICLSFCTRGQPPLKCESCFSGFAIYKIKPIIESGAKYEAAAPDSTNIMSEHVYFNKYLKNVYYNPSMIFIILLNKD